MGRRSFRGRVQAMSKKCMWCQGAGKNTAAYGLAKCTDCEGTGWVDQCVECGEWFAARDINENGMCPECWAKTMLEEGDGI